ncbi:50S ribosomal protein L25 [Wolbachia endosymbiont of Brugia malayi]|uniref:Large ribosomal subunit protein bL25 n=1 Tax=Wolbachia sp. subsp. Brugia malayi (strain TRS) TaxID=292805 RepID=RL25_WOLTR|nr:50S ribosomal protein L25/general stress protein Ctc [Wolbachia endosymbiont of Brugia malayi]Q5GTJ0.1 RecName: Full=Large ribosomal subunit protein bL25; AltName: Full=50S ribosomal protein L25; AltName: Full=General stress protein CTC [Wolbachia endosymbiont strain TRS of Brugia malayi]AAW70684.1 Ribosomal protein L25 (general stress protein Ctc) [Wolbachia endosymbiont strain TRS of Brugia malayi]QCB61667.1 50S ribosomal protein L25 [Wolbachia endosymbiont of Brugia malayi]
MTQQEMITINAELRDVTKTKAIRSLRKKGNIPAVVYGKGHNNVNLTLSAKEFTKQYKLGFLSAHVIELDISGKKEYALVRDIQWHVVKDTIQHVDFQFVDKGSEIKIDIPLSFVNESKSPGIKLGGVLNVLCRSITVKCSPDKIPQAIEVDLSGKMIGQSVHISDVKLPGGVKLAAHEEENFTVVTISAADSGVEESQVETTEE